MRVRFVPLLALPALVLPAACGGDDADPLDLVSEAGAETVDDGTARLDLTTEVESGGASVTTEAEGLVDYEEDRASVTMQLPQDAGDLEVVTAGTTLYIRGPGIAELGATTRWASIDLERVGETTGTDIDELRSSNETASSLALLTGADHVDEVGEEDIDGTETTHYRATVDLRKAAEEAGAVTDRARFEQFVERLGDEDVDVEVWLDGEDRVRRLRYEQAVPDQPEVAVTVTLDLSDFGVDEQVEVPAEGESTDVTERVLRQAQAGTA
jgi:hypothetical protein